MGGSACSTVLCFGHLRRIRGRRSCPTKTTALKCFFKQPNNAMTQLNPLGQGSNFPMGNQMGYKSSLQQPGQQSQVATAAAGPNTAEENDDGPRDGYGHRQQFGPCWWVE